MDVQMPEMSGIDVTKIIREKEKLWGTYTPIIATTAYIMGQDRQSCICAGMDGYTSKPIEMDRLFEIIDTLAK